MTNANNEFEFPLDELEKASNFMLQSQRLASFKDWPFTEDCKCIPEEMAEAGFYHCPTDNCPDAVRCFVCLMTLDGWEPNDDPWKEHKQHEKHPCEFLLLGRKEADLKFREWLDLKLHQAISLATLKTQFKIDQLDKIHEKYIKEAKNFKKCNKS